MKSLAAAIVLAASLSAAACAPSTLHVAPVKIEPIHLQIDVTLHDAAVVPAAPDAARK